jgi:hypothetical protein
MKHAILVLVAVLTATNTRAEAAGSLPDLGWLEGHWCSDEAGRRVDEVWLAPVAGSIHGLSRTSQDTTLESFEFMRIESTGDTMTFLAQPNGAAATAFALVEHGPQKVGFANAAHDFPNRIEYHREGDRLHAQISGPGEDGPMQIPFDYRRCD